MEAFVLWHRTAPAAHDDDADPSADLAWLKRVRARAEGSGANVVGPMGGTIAFVFHAEEWRRGVELALALLDEAEKSPDFAQPPRIALGAALGELDYVPGGDGRSVEFVGGAIDRAQLLGNRARAGEIVLDSRAREVAQGTYLFHRTVGTGEASLRGHAIDREEPRVAACRRNFVHLGRAPTPSSVGDVFASLRDDATSPGSSVIAVRGPNGSGARRCVAELEFTARPALVLRCVGVPGGLEPLGSLRAALVRAYGSGAARVSRLAGLDLATSDVLGRIARGDAVAFDDAAAAIGALLAACRQPEASKPWIVIEPVHEVDESTLEIVGHVARDPRGEVLVVAHVRPETNLPSALARSGRLRELVVPRLRAEEVRTMVEKMLRELPGGEIARRVAATSADTPLAVVECLRAFVASGDVVRRGRTFVFRAGPRVTGERAGYADWAGERIALLDDGPVRLLELLALVPPMLPPADVEALAIADGIEPTSLEKALSCLRDDRFVVASPTVEIDNLALRDVVLARMHPARRAELAASIAARVAALGGFARATHGYYLVESGAVVPAATALLDTADLAVTGGHPRASIRLASAAVQASPTPSIRTRAVALLRGVKVRLPSSPTSEGGRASVEVPADASASPAKVVVSAIQARDFDRVNRIVDLAIAEGASLAAADRWRALVSLFRGDAAAASTAIVRSRERAKLDRPSCARTEIAAALVDLHEHRPDLALRALLTTLAEARENADVPSVDAALRALALCYRALGRETDGRRLLQAIGG